MGDGIHDLLEVKADRFLADDEVLAKAQAATKWARFVTDEGAHGTWRYLVVPESAVKTGTTIRATGRPTCTRSAVLRSSRVRTTEGERGPT